MTIIMIIFILHLGIYFGVGGGGGADTSKYDMRNGTRNVILDKIGGGGII